jgi:hypothetical protein
MIVAEPLTAVDAHQVQWTIGADKSSAQPLEERLGRTVNGGNWLAIVQG